MSLYIYIYGEMVDFWEIWRDDKISGKGDKSNTYNGFSSNILFFIQGRTSLIKERNITTKPIVFDLSIFPFIFIIYIYIYIYVCVCVCVCVCMCVRVCVFYRELLQGNCLKHKPKKDFMELVKNNLRCLV